METLEKTIGNMKSINSRLVRKGFKPIHTGSNPIRYNDNGIYTFKDGPKTLRVHPESWGRTDSSEGQGLSVYEGLNLSFGLEGPVSENTKNYLLELQNVRRDLSKKLQPSIRIVRLSCVPPNHDEIRLPELILEYKKGTPKRLVYDAVMLTQEAVFANMQKYLM